MAKSSANATAMIQTAVSRCLDLEDHWMRMCVSPSAHRTLHKMQSSLSRNTKRCFGLRMQALWAATPAAQRTSTLTAIMPCLCQVQVCQRFLRTSLPTTHIQSRRARGWLMLVSKITSSTQLVSRSNHLDKRVGQSAVVCLSSEQVLHLDFSVQPGH